MSKAERWAALYAIPEEIRPSTIKHSIMLPNIVAITFEYRKGAKDIGPAFRFLRKYGADIRFHNPELKLQRLKTPEGPISLKVSIYKRQNPEPIVL